MKIVILLIALSFILAFGSYMFDGLYELCEIDGEHVYFYDGAFIKSPNEFFLEDGELVYHKTFLGGVKYQTVGVIYLAINFSMYVLAAGLIIKLIKWILRKIRKSGE